MALLWGRFAGGNDANVLALHLDMHNEQHLSQRVVANDSITRFVVAGGVHQPKERIEEHFRRAFKGDAIMDRSVAARFLLVPDKGGAIEFVAHIHRERMSRRMYVVNK